MHPDVLAAISAAGWFPGRRVDIDRWTVPLRGQGYRSSPRVEEVLSFLGGLVVEPYNSYEPNFDNDEPLNFDPKDKQRVKRLNTLPFHFQFL